MAPKEKTKLKTISIHGKEYVPVSERIKEAHEALSENFSITTEVLAFDPIVVIKATVTIPKGIFTGISAANPAKSIEKQSPYEVAETSAVGRALGFAGFGLIDSIASADEVTNAVSSNADNGYKITDKQKEFIKKLLNEKGYLEKDLTLKYSVVSVNDLSGDQASTIIGNLMKLPVKAIQEEIA